MFQRFMGVPPAFVGAEGDEMQIQSNIIIQGVLADPKKPVAAGPSVNGFRPPVELGKDGREPVDLVLKHFFGESSEIVLDEALGFDSALELL
jgi:hypothetical protein